MTTYYQSPINAWFQGFTAQGIVLQAGKLNSYLAGTTTPQTTYTTSLGSAGSSNSNPIILGTDGRPPNEIWVASGISLKWILQDSNSNILATWDNVSSINDVTQPALSEWQDSGFTTGTGLAYNSVDRFTITTTDQTAIFSVGRRIKATVSGGTAYGTIITSTYGAGVNTITLELPGSISLDSGLSAIEYGVLKTQNTSMPMGRDDYFHIIGNVDNTKRLRFDPSSQLTNTTRVVSTPDYNVRLGNIMAGIVVDYAGLTAPIGWLECDGASYLRTDYPDLFDSIGTAWGSVDATHFNVPDFSGRVRLGRGGGTRTFAISNTNTNVASPGTFTVDDNEDAWITGMPVLLTLSSGTITGVTTGNTYYVIRNSSTSIGLALSRANAQNGTGINFTGKASPVGTLVYSLFFRTLGDEGGEEQHAISSTEMLAHTHVITGLSGGGAFGLAAGANAIVSATGSTGGNVAMNTTQPYVAVMTIISY